MSEPTYIPTLINFHNNMESIVAMKEHKGGMVGQLI